MADARGILWRVLVALSIHDALASKSGIRSALLPALCLAQSPVTLVAVVVRVSTIATYAGTPASR